MTMALGNYKALSKKGVLRSSKSKNTELVYKQKQ